MCGVFKNGEGKFDCNLIDLSHVLSYSLSLPLPLHLPLSLSLPLLTSLHCFLRPSTTPYVSPLLLIILDANFAQPYPLSFKHVSGGNDNF